MEPAPGQEGSGARPTVTGSGSMPNEPVYDEEPFRRFEQEGWADVAETYAATFGQVTGQAIGPLLDAVQAAPGCRLLDIACGAGALTAAAAGRGAAAVGVDFVPNMLALAEDIRAFRHEAQGFSNHCVKRRGVPPRIDRPVCAGG